MYSGLSCSASLLKTLLAFSGSQKSDMSIRLKVVTAPKELIEKQAAVVSPNVFPGHLHITISTGRNRLFLFKLIHSDVIRDGDIGIFLAQREWADLRLACKVKVRSYLLQQRIVRITFSVDHMYKPDIPESLNSASMASKLSMLFADRSFTMGESLMLEYMEKGRTFHLSLRVKNIEGIAEHGVVKPQTLNYGKLLADSVITFDREAGALINFFTESKIASAYRSLSHPDWSLSKFGIGGLDDVFMKICKRAFITRRYPKEFIEQMDIQHARGILLFGPPGTGKTLMARQIGKMFSEREAKFVTGPQILANYVVGESEAKIRHLFADAEEEQRRRGASSDLHIIIFDEIDAICKQRGNMAESVPDSMVKQLRSNLDGLEQLNNILLIGTTNRRDLIDEGLLRPGRLNVQIEIELPDEAGRLQILKIHTARLKETGKLDESIDIEKLAKRTEKFSGKELEDLVRAAQSYAMYRHVKQGGHERDAVENSMITMVDVEHALLNEGFGCAENTLKQLGTFRVVEWGQEIKEVIENGGHISEWAQNSPFGVTVCIVGKEKTGVTSIAVEYAKKSNFTYVKMLSAAEMCCLTENAKARYLVEAFNNAKKSTSAAVILDDIEKISEYYGTGSSFSKRIVHQLHVSLHEAPLEGHRLLIIATSHNSHFLREFGFTRVFGEIIEVPSLTTSAHVVKVAELSSERIELDAMEIKELSSRAEDLFASCLKDVGIKSFLEMLVKASRYEKGLKVDELISELERYALRR